MPSPIDAILPLLQPGAMPGAMPDASVSAPMPAPMPMSPQLAPAPNLPMQTPLREAGPSGKNPMHVPWGELLRTLAPALGTMVSGPSRGGFMQGFEHGQQLAAQEKDKRDKEKQQKAQQAEQFRMEVFNQARQITDPQEWAQFVNLATESALHMGLISDPAEMKQFVTYPQHLQDTRRQQELLDRLTPLLKRPDFSDLLHHGATLTMKDGSRISLSDAVTIAGALPEVNGSPVAPPTDKQNPTLKDVEVSVNGKRRFANHNPATGKYTDPATGAELVNAVPWDKPEDPLDRQLKELQIANEKLKLAKGEKPDETSAYSQERAARTLQSVRELSGKVNRWTTGVGSMLAGVPESQARNFKAELDTLKANIAFNELTQMREASKTGGALGAVSDREGALLASALGALDAGQSPANIKEQLKKIEDSVTRWQAAHRIGPVASHGGATPGRVYYDANGNPKK